MSSIGDIPRLLTESLERLGVAVERVRLEEHVSGGGLCNVRGRRIVYLDRNNAIERDIVVLTDALASIADENTFLPPLIREWLDRHAATTSQRS
jgi:hypothetical protein